MLTIAGGIILAVVIIYTFPIWLPIILGMGLIAIASILILAVVLVFSAYPEAGIYNVVVAAVIFGFVYMGELWEKRKSKLKEREKRKTIDKKNIPNRVKALKVDLGSPEVLIRNKSKVEMVEMAKEFEIEFSETDTKREIAEKIFQIGGDESHDLKLKLSVEERIEEAKANEISRLNEQKKEASSLIEKIEEAKANEISRLNEQKNKKIEEKRKNIEFLTKKFHRIKPALEELKQAYLDDNDISIVLLDCTENLPRYRASELKIGDIEIVIYIERNEPEGEYRIWNEGEEENYYFKDPNELINHIIQAIGKFLAERDSRKNNNMLD
jgi:hypothetical protein